MLTRMFSIRFLLAFLAGVLAALPAVGLAGVTISGSVDPAPPPTLSYTLDKTSITFSNFQEGNCSTEKSVYLTNTDTTYRIKTLAFQADTGTLPWSNTGNEPGKLWAVGPFNGTIPSSGTGTWYNATVDIAPNQYFVVPFKTCAGVGFTGSYTYTVNIEARPS